LTTPEEHGSILPNAAELERISRILMHTMHGLSIRSWEQLYQRDDVPPYGWKLTVDRGKIQKEAVGLDFESMRLLVRYVSDMDESIFMYAATALGIDSTRGTAYERLNAVCTVTLLLAIMRQVGEPPL
jgi:hypothetical protein